MHKIEIIQPDDFHIHLRDKNKLLLTVPHASRSFGRVLVMPNLIPPIETIQQVNNYSQAINTILNNHNISNQDFSLLYSYILPRILVN